MTVLKYCTDLINCERNMLPARNFYITDHQGNIAGVYNTRTDSLEQRTGYYPYGLPHASASENGGPETNRRKFGAKELTADLGLNLYDFAARWHNPALPGFTTPDPLAEKYRDISPYVYCAADPINLIDPSGMTIDTSKMTEEELALWNEFKNNYMGRSELFKNLYSFLDENEAVLTVRFGSTKKKDGTTTGGNFDSSNNTITLPTINHNHSVDQASINETESVEELFHAYQRLNSDIYRNVEINKEFEAKTFKVLVNEHSNYPISNFGGDFSLAKDMIESYTDYGNNMGEVLKQIIEKDSNFNRDYIITANKFAKYNIEYNIGDSSYRQQTTSPPVGIINLLLKTTE